MKTISLKEYIEMPKVVKIKKGMTIEAYLSEVGWEGSTNNPIGQPGEKPIINQHAEREDDQIVTSDPFEDAVKKVEEQLNALVQKYFQIILKLSKTVEPQRSGSDPWFFKKGNAPSTFSRYGLGGVMKRLFGGEHGLKGGYGEWVVDGEMSLNEYNEMLEAIEEEVDLMTQYVFNEYWPWQKDFYNPKKSPLVKGLQQMRGSPPGHPGTPDTLLGKGKPATEPVTATIVPPTEVPPVRTPGSPASPAATPANPAGAAGTAQPDPQAMNKIQQAIGEFQKEAVKIIRDAIMDLKGKVAPKPAETPAQTPPTQAPTQTPPAGNKKVQMRLPGFEEWLEGMGATGVVAGNKKLPTDQTFNVQGAQPDGKPYPSRSAKEPSKKKRKK